ncbi:MAG: tetratricopeptide repeat protein [Thermoproteota archaeon]|nr:tetratricopeptide repeat protein [Thermoproteota archaeon]
MGEEKPEDPIKLHKEGTALSDKGKYKKAVEKFLRSAELYKKVGNVFDASYMLYKAGECNYLLKKYEKALEQFLKSAEIAFKRGYDRFAVSALEYARDCYNKLGNEKKTEELEKKIKKVKEKLAKSF